MDKETKIGIKVVLAIVAAFAGYFYASARQSPEQYSSEWIKSLSDDELDRAREKAQQDYLNPALNEKLRENAQRLMFRYDNEIGTRSKARGEHKGPTHHPDHGDHLYKDDD